MIAYKGICQDMTARLGNHDGEVFKIGRTYKVKKAKTAREGYHCCENPAQCLGYYDLRSDRFFKVEASGSIDEDDKERIACTEITILEELDTKGFFKACMSYITAHPDREEWQWSGKGVEISKDEAKAAVIAIARGTDPRAMVGGKIGYIGLIKEDANGELTAARVAKIDGEMRYSGTWYHINSRGIIEEVRP
jgi:hypothetical protein